MNTRQTSASAHGSVDASHRSQRSGERRCRTGEHSALLLILGCATAIGACADDVKHGASNGVAAPAPYAFTANLSAADWRHDMRRSSYILLSVPAGANQPDQHQLWLLPDASGSPASPTLAIIQSKNSRTRESAEADSELQPFNAALTTGTFSVALGARSRQVREAAIVALAAQGQEADAAMLASALTDPSVRIRLAAVEALFDIGGPVADGLLLQASSNPANEVRLAATSALQRQAVRARLREARVVSGPRESALGMQP